MINSELGDRGRPPSTCSRGGVVRREGKVVTGGAARRLGRPRPGRRSAGVDDRIGSGCHGVVLAIAELQGRRRGRRTAACAAHRSGWVGAAREAHDGEGTWRALAVVDRRGTRPRTAAAGALVCRPGLAFGSFGPGGVPELAAWLERSLEADQSNTSTVLGERLLLKVYRRVEAGLNPDLELTAATWPRNSGSLAGARRWPARPSSSAPMAQVGDHRDAREVRGRGRGHAYQTTADRLVGPAPIALRRWPSSSRPRTPPPSARCWPDFTRRWPRPATWRTSPRGRLTKRTFVAGGTGGEPRGSATARAVPGSSSGPVRGGASRPRPLGAGDPAPSRRPGAPERATSPDPDPRRPPPRPDRPHADRLRRGRSRGRTDADDRGASRPRLPDARPGDAPSLVRPRLVERRASGRPARLVARGALGAGSRCVAPPVPGAPAGAYRAGLRRAGSPIVVDQRLVEALEVAKECDEFVYAATYLPEWLWAPHLGMSGLIEGRRPGRPGGPMTR